MIEKVKVVFQRCQKLNSEVATESNSKKPYVVISGCLIAHLMICWKFLTTLNTKKECLEKDTAMKNI